MAQRSRLGVLLSLIGVFLLGVPIWWKTTAIYRADLPPLQLSDARDASWLVNVQVALPQFFGSTSELLQSISSRLDQLSAAPGVQKTKFKVSLGNNPMQFQPGLSDTDFDDFIKARIAKHFTPNKWIFFVFNDPKAPNQGELIFGKYEFAFIRIPYNQESLPRIMDHVSLACQQLFLSDAALADPRLAIPAQVDHRLSFTLASAEGLPFNVNVSDFGVSMNEGLAAFLHNISSVASFRVSSQVKQFVAPGKEPKYDAKKFAYYYTHDVLPYVFRMGDFASDATATSQALLQFVLYLPAASQSPLLIKHGSSWLPSNAYVLPRVGAVAIRNLYDAPEQSSNGISHTDFLDAATVFILHLRDLLGVPKISHPHIKTLYPVKTGITLWELELLQRQRISAYLRNATASLESVYRLMESIRNMPVGDDIRDKVSTVVGNLEASHREAAAGNYVSALKTARVAYAASERLFFDPSMLSQLYFPEDLKYAIYVPMFVPVLMPLVIGLAGELRRATKKETAVTAAKKTN